jgi:F0F1-type ATP synthase assembly protein I
MSSAAANNSDDQSTEPVKPDKSTVILLFTIAADTTWRMFVPVIGGTIIGVWADNMFKSKPVWTIVAITFGVIVAGLLVRQQLKRNIDVK